MGEGGGSGSAGDTWDGDLGSWVGWGWGRSASHQGDGACWARNGGENNLGNDNRSEIGCGGGAVGDLNTRLGAGNDGGVDNGNSGDWADWVGGRSLNLVGAGEESWVAADLVHADTLEVVLSLSDLAISSAVGIQTLVDGADDSLGRAVAVSGSVGGAVGAHGNPGVQALRKNAWVWERSGAFLGNGNSALCGRGGNLGGDNLGLGGNIGGNTGGSGGVATVVWGRDDASRVGRSGLGGSISRNRLWGRLGGSICRNRLWGRLGGSICGNRLWGRLGGSICRNTLWARLGGSISRNTLWGRLGRSVAGNDLGLRDRLSWV